MNASRTENYEICSDMPSIEAGALQNIYIYIYPLESLAKSVTRQTV